MSGLSIVLHCIFVCAYLDQLHMSTLDCQFRLVNLCLGRTHLNNSFSEGTGMDSSTVHPLLGVIKWSLRDVAGKRVAGHTESINYFFERIKSPYL